MEEEMARKKLEIIAQSTARLNLLRSEPSLFSSGITIGPTGGFLPVPKQTDAPLFEYEELEMPNNGPKAPSIEELLEQAQSRIQARQQPFGRLVREPGVPEKAGGYHQVLEVRRALLDSFADICFNPKVEAGIKNFPYDENENADVEDSVEPMMEN
jgi:hypothetical protein